MILTGKQVEAIADLADGYDIEVVPFGTVAAVFRPEENDLFSVYPNGEVLGERRYGSTHKLGGEVSVC